MDFVLFKATLIHLSSLIKKGKEKQAKQAKQAKTAYAGETRRSKNSHKISTFRLKKQVRDSQLILRFSTKRRRKQSVARKPRMLLWTTA